MMVRTVSSVNRKYSVGIRIVVFSLLINPVNPVNKRILPNHYGAGNIWLVGAGSHWARSGGSHCKRMPWQIVG